MDKNYKNLIFTKHALERLDLRHISVHDIWEVINYPDKKNKNKFIKKVSSRKIHVVAESLTTSGEGEKKWLVISVWVRGEDDPTPIAWQIITLPFKLLWWLIKHLFFSSSR